MVASGSKFLDGVKHLAAGTRRLPTELCNAVWIEDRSMFERLLELGCTESPACQCGGEMHVSAIETLPEGSDAAVGSIGVMSVSARCG